MFIETVNSIIQQHSGIGFNKFSIKCSLWKDHSDHLDRWISFAFASKARILDMNLWPQRNNVRPTEQVYHFPLEALGAQDCPFIQSLFLTNVSIETPSYICGFAKLRKLHLHRVQVVGNLPGLLLNCSILEDLALITCSGVADLNIPHQLDKLRHLLISNMRVQMVGFCVPDLSYFWYQGAVIPIVLDGCSKLQKAILTFHRRWVEEDHIKVLGHVFNGIPSISAMKVLNVHANMHINKPVWSLQVHILTTRATCMFMNLRHLAYEITIVTKDPNSHSGILQLAQYLALAPHLETLELHVSCLLSCFCFFVDKQQQQQQQQQQHSLFPQASWGRLEMKPERNKFKVQAH